MIAELIRIQLDKPIKFVLVLVSPSMLRRLSRQPMRTL